MSANNKGANSQDHGPGLSSSNDNSHNNDNNDNNKNESSTIMEIETSAATSVSRTPTGTVDQTVFFPNELAADVFMPRHEFPVEFSALLSSLAIDSPVVALTAHVTKIAVLKKNYECFMKVAGVLTVLKRN